MAMMNRRAFLKGLRDTAAAAMIATSISIPMGGQSRDLLSAIRDKFNINVEWVADRLTFVATGTAKRKGKEFEASEIVEAKTAEEVLNNAHVINNIRTTLEAI